MQTLGGAPSFDLRYDTTSFSNGSNSSLYVELKANRSLTHLTTITTSKGSRVLSWNQEGGYANGQNITAAGRNETLALDILSSTTFSPASTTSQNSSEGTEFNGINLLSFYQAYAPSPDERLANSTIFGIIDQGEASNGQRALDNLIYPAAGEKADALVPAGSWGDFEYDYATRQNGSCFYIWNNTYYEDAGPIDPADGTLGATEQWFDSQQYVTSPTGPLVLNYTRYADVLDGYEPRLEADEIGTGRLNVPQPEILHGDGVNDLPVGSWDDFS